MADFNYMGELTRDQKADFLRSIDINCVPSPYADPKGLYVLETMAVGTPVASPSASIGRRSRVVPEELA